MEELLGVFMRTREVLARPESDFAWSGWENADEALHEIDKVLAKLRIGKMPNRDHMTLLFLPTGPIQEVSLSSGWGHEFLKLASDFDAALQRAGG